MKRVELLAPAGDLEKLKIAILYGADAVFIGGKNVWGEVNCYIWKLFGCNEKIWCDIIGRDKLEFFRES